MTAKHRLGAMQTLDFPMKTYSPADEVDFVIVGVGAAGGVLLQRLARAGFSVVGIEAGPFWDTERDWVSDEAGSHQLYWTQPRVIGGENPVTLGSNNSGCGVGGGSVHWASFVPRFHPSDFRIHTLDGVGVDWPFAYETLKPYYEMLEREMPVSGPHIPWGDPHSYIYGAHGPIATGDILIKGCTALGIRAVEGGPVAILNGSYADRPHCIYRGFCIQGCKVGAKQSTLISHVPDAIEDGAEIRANSMAARIETKHGRVTGVAYYDQGGALAFQKAKVVIVSGYAIETPRLLLNSAAPGFEQGLANSSGTLGRYVMVQAGNVVSARFDDLVRMYKGPPAHSMTEEFYETDPKRGFARGFAIQTIGPLPISFAKHMAASWDAWGWGMRKLMMDYNHWMSLGVMGEVLPWADNRVTLAEKKDRYGLPVAKFDFTLHDNDKEMIRFAVAKTKDVLEAAGGKQITQDPRFAHLVGGARMGNDPDSSVVDRFCGAHDVPNLFVCDGSVLPTQGAANPGLTIQSLAARLGDYLTEQAPALLAGRKRELVEPTIRPKHGPRHAQKARGMPRF